MGHSDAIRQLLTACEEGNVSVVQALLDQGIDVDAVDGDDVTPLQVCAANGFEHLVRLLLMRGAALDKANSFGWTPLMHASRHGHSNVVGLLLQNKADINAQNRLGASALTIATRGGHLQTSKLLIEAGIDLSPSTGIGGTTCEFTPLMAAAQFGHDAVTRYLLDRGFDVNYRTPSTGINSLMLAALNGHMTTSQILIERGVDPNLTNVNGHTPLEIATIRGKREVMGYLDRKTTNKPRIAPEEIKPDIIEAAKRGDLLRMREILTEDLTQRDACSPQDGATPLMFAAMMGRLDMVQVLWEAGCDINKQDTVSGWTALMQATYHGKKAVAKYLINANADVLIPAKNGCTAFDMASLIDDVDTELYRLLAAKAVQVNRLEKRKNWATKSNTPSSSDSNGLITSVSTTALTTVSTVAAPLNSTSDEPPRSGLRAWWSRMSNRFRNLKLGRTFNLQTNRLAPLPDQMPANDGTLKNANSSPKRSPQHAPKKSLSVDELSTTTSSNVSYETIMLETKKSASMYTLVQGLHAPHSTLQDGTLKPVRPPFLPPPTFETDRPKMPPTSARRSVSTNKSSTLLSNHPVVQPMKFLQSHSSSMQNLNISSTSPSLKCPFSSPSAPSSGGLTINSKHRVSSSASSSTLTAGSDTLNKSGGFHALVEPFYTPVRSPIHFTYRNTSPSHIPRISHISPSSTSGESLTLTAHKQARTKSGSSHESTNSTLTPSPSPTLKVTEGSRPSSSSRSMSSHQRMSSAGEDDELGGLLKNLALEQYQPIFEEQEVDMEAFLTLSDGDLKELGIAQIEPRRQILSAITELKSGKGRERLHYHETMTQFQTALSTQSHISTGHPNFSRWNLQPGGNQPVEHSTKSRSS